MATFAENRNAVLVWLALGALALLVLVGIVYGSKPAYRHLYADVIEDVRARIPRSPPSAADANQAGPGSYPAEERRPEDLLSPHAWYIAMIDLERKIYGPEQADNDYLLPWEPVRTLQQGLDSERTGLWIVQGLWLLVIILLVASVLA